MLLSRKLLLKYPLRKRPRHNKNVRQGSEKIGVLFFVQITQFQIKISEKIREKDCIFPVFPVY